VRARALGTLLAASLLAVLLLAVPSASAQEPVFLLDPFKPAPGPGTPPGSEDGKPAPDPPPPARPYQPQNLSNETTLSRWAYVLEATPARRLPKMESKVVKRLKTYTSDGTPELVLLLQRVKRKDGSVWVKVRLPMRPNGRTGWVPRPRLGRFRKVRQQLVVDRRRFRATLFDNGRAVWSSRIGVGEPRWPTPTGRYYVRERLIPREKNGIYGVFAFGTSAYSDVLTDWPGGGVIGIHGTNQPGILPGRVSHGCVRVPNKNIRELRGMVSLGTPILIR